MKRVLKLNKEVIASLNGEVMNRINGGDTGCAPTITNYSCPTKCPQWTCQTKFTCVETYPPPCGV